jgi:hypothetical protein
MTKFISEKIKQENEVVLQTRLLLKEHNKKYERPSRKISHEHMLKALPNLSLVKEFWIRNPSEWSAKSFNIYKQVIEFVSWVLCEYPVPLFMYDLFRIRCTKEKGVQTLYPKHSIMPFKQTYLYWFITIGQGGSFRKVAKDTFSKKEAGLFLTAPKDNTISGNILWSKCVAHGTSSMVTYELCKNYGPPRLSIRNKYIWDKIIAFYARYPDIDFDTLQNTLDFIYNKFTTNKNFTLANRTLNSIIQLTNEWHEEVQKQKGVVYSEWGGIPVQDWELEINGGKWNITQILNSKKLLHEGRVMRHCVGSYVNVCRIGASGIFTVEYNCSKVLTVEVNSDLTIVQIRGKCNKPPNKTEMYIVKQWARKEGLKFSRYFFTY